MTRAYVDRRVGDLAAATRVAELAAERWDLAEPLVLRLGMNAIFRSGETVLRVAQPNASPLVALALAEELSNAGIRVNHPVRDEAVESEGLTATAWEHVEAVEASTDWGEVGSMVRGVHEIAAERLPSGLPMPSPADFPWWHHDRLLAEVVAEIDPIAADGLRSAMGRHRRWRQLVGSDRVVCHGDVHPGNVIMSADGPVLIDWDLLCCAPRGWDHAPLMTWSERWGGEPGIYDAFATGYGWSATGDAAADAFAELRLVSATLMRWKVALHEPAARPEAERRLAYWRGEPNAPSWRAQ